MVNGSAVTYVYETSSNFLLFVAVDRNSVELAVDLLDAFGMQQERLLVTTITDKSEPWVVINRQDP